MVVMYNIMGRQVGSHHVRAHSDIGGSKKITGSTPPINASSKDEADFIQYFLKESEKKEAKH
ncbi:unnamed protein product [Aureobasidium pullulans]|nr:unnamed protein product [Aureobasidium pullulans]